MSTYVSILAGSPFFIFNLWHFNYDVIGVVLFGSILFGTLCASWTCMPISSTKLKRFPFITFSNKFSISCSSFSPFTTPMIWMLEHLKLSQRFLSLSSFFYLRLSKSNYFKIYLLMMLLQLSHFPPFIPLHLAHPLPPTFSHPFSSCLWVVHISSLASPFPILFLTSPVYFVPSIYAK